ncbi:MAG: secretin N-terminal domain-containing protein, partial [Candidatus Edwardsbacteria bacterium]|nr:secretin N-terminal domain-containing protein [Candidatus Edwardsbacteria bacterium]
PSAPTAVTPSRPAPSPAVEEQPVTPAAPTATPSRPTPPPVIEEKLVEPVYAATQPAPMPFTPTYVESPKPAYRPTSAIGRGLLGGGLVSMDLENADIVTVLRAMAQYSKRNLIIGVDVKGSVSMTLHNVSWGRAFGELVRAAGLGYAEESGIIRVGTSAKMQEEIRNRAQSQDLVTQVYRIEYAIANELTGSLTRLLSERGSVLTDQRSNSLVITDVGYKQDEVLQLIKILDTQSPQVEIMARIVDIDMDASKELGINWSVSNMASYANNIDIKKVALPSPLPTLDRLSVQVGTIRSFAQLDATITALESSRKANTISNPRIMAVNNKEAKIVGGKKIPISMRDPSGNAVTSLYTIGMVLTATPHINSANNITLEVKTEISDIDQTTTVGGGVVILTNEATTQIVLNDGETAVIGGLVQTKSGKSTRGIPILMNIPIIGALFRNTSTSTAKREILIFLTPHLIKSI